ncbi:hypothetical protein [Streptomyces sp. NPDC051098]|uniref:hypothetical protein n=1 Tax=Streptomyces sp. NPDC051098 TaxID=3155411 RepID=UPI003439F254
MRASTRAIDILTAVLAGLGPGRHTLTCVARTEAPEPPTITAVHHIQLIAGPVPAIVTCPSEAKDAAAVMALATITGGSLLARTDVAEGSTVQAWRIQGVAPPPLSEAQIFASYCTDPFGEPLPPVPGHEYKAAFPVTLPDPC